MKTLIKPGNVLSPHIRVLFIFPWWLVSLLSNVMQSPPTKRADDGNGGKAKKREEGMGYSHW